MKRNLPIIVTHLEHVASRGNKEEAARAKGYLKTLTSVQFIMMLHSMLDILSILSCLSQIFQRDDLLTLDVLEETQLCLIKLLDLKINSGCNMKEFVSLYQPEIKQFQGIDISEPVPIVNDFTNCNNLQKLVDDMVIYITTRFANFHEVPLVSFRAFDYHHFPDDMTALAQHGQSDISGILQHMIQLFPRDTHTSILEQYNALKVHLRQYKKSKSEVFSSILLQNQERFSAILKVVEIMMVISPSTATCERGFSAMNLVKTNLRAKLSQSSLQNLLTIMIDGPLLKDFVPGPAIDAWYDIGGKHIHGHKTPALSPKLQE